MKVISQQSRRARLVSTAFASVMLAAGHIGIARADSAVARDRSEHYFDGTGASLPDARAAALSACQRQGGHGCHVVFNSKPHAGGFGAAVVNDTTAFYVAGYQDADAAFDAATANCRQNSRPDEACELEVQWADWHYVTRIRRGPVIVQQPSEPERQVMPNADTRTWHYEDSHGNYGDAMDWNGNFNALVYK